MFTWMLQYPSLDFREILGNITIQLNHNVWPDVHSILMLMVLQVFLQFCSPMGLWRRFLFSCLHFVGCGCCKLLVGKQPQQDGDIIGLSLTVATVQPIPLSLYFGRYGAYLGVFLLPLKANPCVWEWMMSLWKSLEKGLGAQERNASRSWSRKGWRNTFLRCQQVKGKECPGRVRHDSWALSTAL